MLTLHTDMRKRQTFGDEAFTGNCLRQRKCQCDALVQAQAARKEAEGIRREPKQTFGRKTDKGSA